MLHSKRRHNIQPFEGEASALVAMIIGRSWVTCAGFRWRSLFILNDSTSEDGITEFAIIRNGRQVESITFGWLDDSRPDRIAEIADYLVSLDADQAAGCDYGAVELLPHPEGYCHACA